MQTTFCVLNVPPFSLVCPGLYLGSEMFKGRPSAFPLSMTKNQFPIAVVHFSRRIGTAEDSRAPVAGHENIMVYVCTII